VKRSDSIPSAVQLVFSPAAEFIRPLQNRAEIEALVSMLAMRRPAVVVEIGTASGGGLLLFARAAARDALIVSIDLPGGEFGGGYPPWRVPLYRTFAGPQQVLRLIRGDSHAPETAHRLALMLAGRKIDFLFIDGDHTCQGVAQDFEIYRPLVRPDGIIAFHDIVKHPAGSRCEVDRFWNRIKARFEHLEIVADPSAGFAGIGVIMIDKPRH
jgi:predicted O-methyltransferase YrrM